MLLLFFVLKIVKSFEDNKKSEFNLISRRWVKKREICRFYKAIKLLIKTNTEKQLFCAECVLVKSV